jgi:phospholipid/cholesterol/gamma-HCH transport system permease protein
MYFTTQASGASLAVRLQGEWRAADLAAIERQLAALPLSGVQQLVIGTAALGALDLSGAWLLRDFALRAAAAGADVSYPDGRPEAVDLVEATLAATSGSDLAARLAAAERARLEDLATGERAAAAVGRRVVHSAEGVVKGLAFVGALASMIGTAALRPHRWRPISIARHVYDTGITAIPIVALIAFLISVITAYMGAQQLVKFGADIFVVDLVTVGTLREMGVLLTAIIVAGRSGSAFAAEIGAMRLNEEIDALKVIGLVIALPLLTIIADAVGLAGGALLCRFLLDMPFLQFITRMEESIGTYTFWVGIWKAPVFALLIAAAGTYRGLQVRGSSRELGRLTTVAVVQSIFLVILADALFAVLFMELDI